MASPADLRPGDRVGPFELEARLRAGAELTCWRALRPDGDGRRVRLEIAEGASVARFLDARRVLAERRPPGIVPVMRVGSAGSRAFAAVAIPAGPSLAEALERRKELPAPAAAALGRSLARALAEALEAGVTPSRWGLDDVELGPGAEVRLFPRAFGLTPGPESPAALLAGFLESALPERGSASRPELRRALARARVASGDPRAALRSLEGALASLGEPEALSAWWSGEGQSVIENDTDPQSAVDDATEPRGFDALASGDPTQPGMALDEVSALEPPTLHDTEAIEAPTIDGAVADPRLPEVESVTELDEGLEREDATAVAVLDAFAPTPPGRAFASREDSDGGATPSDPFARFDALRVPSKSEIDEAIRGVPTMALEPTAAPPPAEEDGPSVDEPHDPTAPVSVLGASTAIVERSRAPDPAGSSAGSGWPAEVDTLSDADEPPARFDLPFGRHRPEPHASAPAVRASAPAVRASEEPAPASASRRRSFEPRPPPGPPARGGAERWLLPFLAVILAAVATALAVALYFEGA